MLAALEPPFLTIAYRCVFFWLWHFVPIIPRRYREQIGMLNLAGAKHAGPSTQHRNTIFDEFCVYDEKRVVVLWMLKLKTAQHDQRL